MSEQKPFDFESVQYPMFKVTEEEKQDLIRARAMPANATEFLCIRVNVSSLESKIAAALGGYHATLETYLFPGDESTSNDELFEKYNYDCRYPNKRDSRKLRDVWVDKLLAFNS
jgi:hypothetical protein